MTRRSKSSLFLIEQLVVVAVFAVCAAACVSILTISFLNARDTSNLSRAIVVAESAAESFKALSGDLERTAELLGGYVVTNDRRWQDALIVFYDEAWLISNAQNAEFVLRIVPYEDSPIATVVTRRLYVGTIDGDVLLTFPLTARLMYGGTDR